MKKILSIAAAAVLLLGLCFGLSALINKSAENIDENVETDSIYIIKADTDLPEGLEVFSSTDSAASKPRLWRVTSADGNVLYMTGTIHALTPEYYPVSSAVGAAFDECSALAVEFRNFDRPGQFLSDGEDDEYDGSLSKGDSLKAHLSDEVYSILSDYLAADGLDIKDYDGYAPWYVYSNFVRSEIEIELSGEYGFDRILQLKAFHDDKEILSVETLEAKEAIYPNMPDNIVGLLIKRSCTEDSEDVEQLARLWASGDYDALIGLSLSDEGLNDADKAVWQEYLDYMIHDRNVIMAAKADEYLKSGQKVFMAVGANHYAGDKGIVALLEAKGYTVEIVE